MKFDGTCGTCGLRIDYACPISIRSLDLDLDDDCISLSKRTDWIKSLVTSPEFVPEEVQTDIIKGWAYGLEEGSDE